MKQITQSEPWAHLIARQDESREDSPFKGEEPAITKAGFVGIVGRPNVGKSTLLNQILGEKLAIASPKPQTTRDRLLGVTTIASTQFAFIDTPGLHRTSGKGRTLLNQYMHEQSQHALAEVDVVVLMTDVQSLRKEDSRKAGLIDPSDLYIASQLPKNKPVLLAINKVDLLGDKSQLLPAMEAWQALFPFQSMVPISAQTGEGVDRLLTNLGELLPQGQALFSKDTLTDRTERYLCAEKIREQIFLATHEEIPYAVAVTVDQWAENIAEEGPKQGMRVGVRIDATIHVEKQAQKRILVGQRGQMIKDIGTAARAEIKELLGCGVQLYLFVRVDENWSQKQQGLREMGYV